MSQHYMGGNSVITNTQAILFADGTIQSTAASGVTSDQVTNESTVSGADVTHALDALNVQSGSGFVTIGHVFPAVPTLVGFVVGTPFAGGAGAYMVAEPGVEVAYSLSDGLGDYISSNINSGNPAFLIENTAGYYTSVKPGVIEIHGFTVASLPTGTEGDESYATNGRKVGEGVGAGTGVPIYFSTGQWRVYSTDAQVQA